MNDDLGSMLHAAQAFVPLCAIGASAGGVSALQDMFRQLPTDLGMAYVVILHLSPDHPSALSQVLSACTRMPVHTVDDTSVLQADCVFVISPNRELVIDGDNLTARPFTEPRGHRAPVDVFFRSAAAARGDGIAVVLSGTGADGANGVRSVKEAGGIVMVQNPAEAGFESMPQSAIATGVADFVAPIARLVEQMREVAQSKEAVRSLDLDEAANDLRRIVAFLRARTGHDFSSYKRATVMRRVARRMAVCRAATPTAYAEYLYSTPEEAKELFADLLISVTMFFRDPSAFEALERHAVASLFDTADAGEEGIRAWVVGCATGEEAYSVAMLLMEEADRRKVAPRIQIFATDLDDRALATAREGRYPRIIEADVSEERLSRFFVDEGTHYRVRKKLRETVLFASHSVLKEMPFLRLDLVTCRNLLIYLEQSLQHQLCALFHYGLKPGRFLFLGSAETADVAADLFSPVDRKARVYCARTQVENRLPLLQQVPLLDRFAAAGRAASPGRVDGGGRSAQLHAAALEQAAPPSVLVDDGQNIVHLSPSAGRFLLHSAGPLSINLPAVIRPELRLDLRMALARALEQKLPMLTHPVAVAFDGAKRRISVQVSPVLGGPHAAAQALVVFLDGGAVADAPAAGPDTPLGEMRRVRGELEAAQEALAASRNGHDTSIQELRVANEELQSMNEEYRSTAEELETSKEELQSVNEELHTVNAELKSKLDTISEAHNDLQNLTAATEIGTLFLDPDLRIRMFTPPIADLFNIKSGDIGRVVTDFTHQLDYDSIEADVRRVLNELAPVEREVRSVSGHSYLMRLRPYRTVENRIDGTVVTFVDISARLGAEAALTRAEQQLRTLVRPSSQVLYRMSPRWDGMRELFGGALLSETERPDESWIDHYIPEADHPQVAAAIREAVHAKSTFDIEHRMRRPDSTVGWSHSRAVPLLDAGGEIVEWFGSASDVTQRRRAENALRESEDRLRVLIEGVPQLVWRSVDSGQWTWSSPQWHAYTGLSEKESRAHGWLAAIHPDNRESSMAAWNDAPRTRVFEVECRIGNVEEKQYRWFQARAVPLLDADGRIVEWLGTSTDVDDLRRLQESQAVMVAELQHRTRNLIAVVRSIAEQTMGTTDTLALFRDKFNDRIAALSRVQNLLSRADQAPITIGALVRTELDALGAATMPDRVSLSGPEVPLRNATVQTLALALHELATNAVKYGALMTENGRLAVSWRSYKQDGDGLRLGLEWTETGGDGRPAANGPAPGGGYGRELIENALPYALGAWTSYQLSEDGVRCSIDLPLAAEPRVGTAVSTVGHERASSMATGLNRVD